MCLYNHESLHGIQFETQNIIPSLNAYKLDDFLECTNEHFTLHLNELEMLSFD